MLFKLGDIAVVVSAIGLNVRSDTQATSTRLFGIPKNTRVEIISDAESDLGEKHLWYKVRVLDGEHAGSEGYCASGTDDGVEEYLLKAGVAPPPPTGVLWKPAPHFVASGEGIEERQASELVAKLHSAGKKLRSAMVVNAVNCANQLLGLERDLDLTFRFRFAIPLPGGGEQEIAPSHPMFAFNATEYSKVMLPVFAQVPGAKRYQIANEHMHDDNLALYTQEVDFYINSFKIYADHGMKITFGDWAPTHPTLTNSEIRKQNDRLFKAAEQYGAVANLHVYSPTLAANPDHGNDSMFVEFATWAGRIIEMARLYPNVKFIGGEAGLGQADYLGDVKFRQITTELNDMVKGIPNILWVYLWTLAGGRLNSWLRSDWGASINSYVEMSK